MNGTIDLLALTDFTLVAKHGGFGRAARAAGRPKATLSRRVAELEIALGLRLFERGRRDLRLTEEGRALFERSSPLLTELDETAVAIAAGGGEPRGRLRISAPLLFSQMAMGRLAASYAKQYPEVAVEVSGEDRLVDMVEEGYDLVIRVNPPSDDSLIGRAFLHDRLVAVVSPALASEAAKGNVAAVVRHGSRSTHWDLRTATGPRAVAIHPVLRLSSVMMVLDAVRAGVGAGLLPVSLVSRDLAAGRLVQLGEAKEPPIALWALYPSRRLLSARVSSFIDHLATAFPAGTPDDLARYMI